MDLKTALKKKLTKKQLGMLKASFDTIGSVAILEIPEELEKKEKLIAETLISLNKNIKTVCKKAGDREGKFRLRKLIKLAGNGFETIHTEFGCRYKLDLRKAYFSPRESTERNYIAGKVRPYEKVLVMFSGIGPFGILVAKRQPRCSAVCVELNPKAVEYADENKKLNKVADRVENICGDVKAVCQKLGKFDRIIAPLPETAYKYLDTMLACCKKGGMIYLYGICEESKKWEVSISLDNPSNWESIKPAAGEIDYSRLVDEIKKAAKKENKKIRILKKRKVLPYRPRTFKVCVEIKLI